MHTNLKSQKINVHCLYVVCVCVSFHRMLWDPTVIVIRMYRSRLRFPPGPIGYPIIGSVWAFNRNTMQFHQKLFHFYETHTHTAHCTDLSQVCVKKKH